MTTCKISTNLRLFFDAEERNREAMMSEFRLKQRPELEPPTQTLATAMDSLHQAPGDVIIQWFGFNTTGDAANVFPHLVEMMSLIAIHGADTPLSEFG